MKNEVWVLGATGRTGRAVAMSLHESGVPLVLAGRNRERLESVANELGGAPRLLAGSLDSTLAQLAQDGPGVVVNTIGPFTETATRVAQACPGGTHYVDVANELTAVDSVLELDRRAAAADQVFVTGAGFGVLGTESVILRLCEGQAPPTQVRVDALPSVAIERGVIGTALAGTIVEVLSFGGRQVRQGRLVPSRLAADPAQLTAPDGEVFATASGASGELLAAWRASKADFVVAASTAAPTNAVARLVMAAVPPILRIPAVNGVATTMTARIPLRPKAQPRPYSWTHARAEWSSGTVREGWLRTGDAMTFTVAVVTEVTQRLLRGEGRRGSHTPGALFGPELAEAAGAELIVDHRIHSEKKG